MTYIYASPHLGGLQVCNSCWNLMFAYNVGAGTWYEVMCKVGMKFPWDSSAV